MKTNRGLGLTATAHVIHIVIFSNVRKNIVKETHKPPQKYVNM